MTDHALETPFGAGRIGLPPRPRSSRRQRGSRSIVVTGLVILVVLAYRGTGINVGEFFSGIHGMSDLVHRALPPDFSQFHQAWHAVVETVYIAVIGTFGGVVLGLPIALCAAANTSPHRAVYYTTRGLIGMARSVDSIIWALIFVAAVGLGDFPAVLALIVHSVGMLGRLLAEVIEDVDRAPVEALTVTGASRLQIITHAVLPEVLPSVIGISLYRLDENLRSSVALGFVGAGGIGFQLISAMDLFKYREVSLDLLLTFAVVLIAERISAYIRRRVA